MNNATKILTKYNPFHKNETKGEGGYLATLWYQIKFMHI